MAASAISFADSPSLLQLKRPTPVGGIISFAGAILDIPVDWQLCDGTNGTPDLRNQFVPGAGDRYAVDADHEDDTHSHNAPLASHVHAPGGTQDDSGVGIESVWGPVDSAAADAADSFLDGTSTSPPFYALAYIQRMV